MVEVLSRQMIVKSGFSENPEAGKYGFTVPLIFSMVPSKTPQEEQKVQFIRDKFVLEFNISKSVPYENRLTEMNKIMEAKGYAYHAVSEYHGIYSDAKGDHYFLADNYESESNIKCKLYRIPSVAEYAKFMKEHKYTMTYNYNAECGHCLSDVAKLESVQGNAALAAEGLGIMLLDSRGFPYVQKNIPSDHALYVNGCPVWSDTYLDNGDPKEVISSLLKSAPSLDYVERIRIDPKDAEAYVLRADAARNFADDSKSSLKDYNMAIELYNELPPTQERDSSLATAYLKRAELKNFLDDLKGRLSDISSAIELSPKDAELYSERAMLQYYKLKRPKDAIIDLDKAISLDPKKALYHNLRADIKRDKKDYKGAIEDYTWIIDNAVKGSLDQGYAYGDRARCKYSLKDFDGHKEDIEKAKQILDRK